MVRDQKSEIYAFSHIPKTAGMTLSHLLRRNFGCGHVTVAYRGNEATYTLVDLRRDLSIQPFAKSIAGHSLKPHIDFRPYNLKWFTFLRNPVDRFISHYQHEIEKGGKVCGFREWYKTYRRGNWQTQMIAGCEDLAVAKKILAEKFSFVGLQEYFNESLLMLRTQLSMDDFDVSYPRKINPSKSNAVREAIMRDYNSFEAEVLDQNSLDIELYDFVLSEIWPTQVREYGYDRIQDDLSSCFNIDHGQLKRLRFKIYTAGYLAQRNLLYKPYIAIEKQIGRPR